MSVLTKDGFVESQPSQLNIFQVPSTQTACEAIYFEECRPTSQVIGYSPIEFNVSGQNGMDYIDLKRSKLYVKLRVKNSDGSVLDEADTAGPVNLFLQSLWSQVDVYLQGQLVTSSNTNYPYKCMMKTLLQYGQDAKSTQLSSSLYIKDRSGHMDVASGKGSNTGLYERRKFISESKSLDLEGPLCHDLCEMDRYLLNMVDVKVKIYRNKPNFCLMSDEISTEYDIIIDDIVFKVCKIRVNPAVIYAHADALKSTNAKYPFTKSVIKHITLMQGSSAMVIENIFQDVKPKRMVVGFTSSEAVSGSYKRNPFYFKNYDLQQISLFCDGIPVEGIPLKLDFNQTNGTSNVSAFVKMFETGGKWMMDAGNDITRMEFNDGYTLFCFELEPCFQESEYLTLIKRGKIRLECQFGTPLPETVSVIIFAENFGYFEITENRQIKTE